MLELSDIQFSQEELQDYYAQLRAQHVTPAWIGGGISIEPQSKAVPYLWHWRDLRPQAMRAADLVGTQQAERRVLRLTNPELSGVSASNTLVANIQIVMPGEIARAHRHSAAALRLIIEGGAVTPSSTVSASRCTRAISSSPPTGHGTTTPTTPMRR
jgi:gentisate 1,2-dioxygenase